MGRNSKKKKGSASRRKGRSRATPNDQFGEDDQDLLSEEITALSAIFQEDFQILSRSSQTHISINLRPHSDATGYENQDVSAILSVRCLPGYPFKCPKLQVEPEKGLMQVDVDKLLSLLLDQANSNSREGRVMIFNLVEVAQEFLSEILSAQETIDCASSLVSGDKEGWPMTCGSSGYVKESFVSGLYDLFSEFCGDDGSWYHGIGTVVNDDKKKIARDHIFDINKDQQSTVSVHKIDTSRIGNVVPRMHQFLNYESRIVDVSRDIQIPSILDKSYNPKEGMADRNGSTSSEFSTTSPWVKSIREDLEEEKQTKGVINPMAKDLGIDQQKETSYSGLEDQTSNILATSSLLDDKKDLFMAYLLRLSCSTKGSLTLALPEITSELCNLGMLSEKARDLSSEPPSTFNKKFNSTFQPYMASSQVSEFWKASVDFTQETSPVNSRYLSDFEEIRYLGHGGFGHVVLCKNKLDGRQYAVKKIRLKNKSSPFNEKILREVATLARLQHQHVVRYYQAWFETEIGCHVGSTAYTSMAGESSDDYFGSLSTNAAKSKTQQDSMYLYIQMEYCPGTLRQHFEKYQHSLDKELNWHLFRQIVEGLAHIHSHGIIHRDLTPNNIFFDARNDIKIGDFGLAKFLKLEQSDQDSSPSELTGNSVDGTGQVGTYFYTAPEIEQGWPQINEKVDMYSLGVVFFELWHSFGTAMERHAVLSDLKLKGILPPAWVTKFPEQSSIVQSLMLRQQSNRPSARELLQTALPPRMEDEWLNDILRTIQTSEDTYVYDQVISTIFDEERITLKGQRQHVERDKITQDESFFVQYPKDMSAFRDIVTEASREVFRKHGSMRLEITPMCLLSGYQQPKRKVVKVLTVGEIKLSIRRSLVKLGFSFISKDPKVQLLICDLEIMVRHSDKKTSKITNKPRSSSRGKWMVLANIARFLSVSVIDLIVKMPKVTIEVKNMGLDLFKTNTSKNLTLKAKLHSVPLLLHFPDPSVGDQLGSFLDTHVFSSVSEKDVIPFICDDLSLECEFGHNREIGIGIRGLDVTSGDVTLNLSEDMFLRNTSETSLRADMSETEVLKPTIAKKSNSIASLKKTFLMFPDKVSFNLPKLDLKYLHHGQGFYIENNIMGIHLKSSKSQYFEDTGEETSHFDAQMDFSEIHLLSEGSSSILEILKVDVITSIDVPMQSDNPVRTEIDVRLGGTQCNIIPSRLMPLLCLQQSKEKKLVLKERGANSHQESPPLIENKAIMWTCTVSAPEMNIVLHDIIDLPLYHVCSQSSHLFANNIARNGVQVHTELGELHLYKADEHQVSFKENLFGIEANYGSLVHIARVSLDLGHRETEVHNRNCCLVFSVDVTGMGVGLNIQQVESLASNVMSFKSLLQKLSFGKKEKSNLGHSRKLSPRGVQNFKLNLEQCSVIFSGDVGVEDTVVADPKRVNFGSQGGKVTISVSANGTTRQAHITSMVSNGRKCLKNSTVLDIFHLSLDANKEKQSTRIELERARSIYKEYSEELGPITNITLFDVQNAKFVRRPGGLNENSICSLFSATDITARWEPDVHLALYEVALRLRFMLHNMKLKHSNNETPEVLNMKTVGQKMEHDKQKMKKDSVFAVDIEVLRISAELADGVEALVQVQSIFSENAKIGILLEGLVLSFNDARVFKSSRMQISRLPNDIRDGINLVATRWDWVIQGLDVHICMPYRLPLRAIEDAVEDTLRGLKLICSAKTRILFPAENNGTKVAKTGSSMFGSFKFNIRKLSAEIEEEPLQGWLDEHYHLMKNQFSESATRLNFFDDLISEARECTGIEQNGMITEKKVRYDGVDIDVLNLLDIEKLREEIQKKSFRSYFLECQKLVHSRGSGACTSGLQAGFKPSAARSSLLSFVATELDLKLDRIEGDDIGMIKFIRNLDAVSVDNDIPFSRLYGRNMVLHTGSLIAQIRNYSFPIFSGTLGKCEGCVVLAQQATCFQPQIEQNIYIGRWRKVCMLRSASGTTPPMKMYSNLPIFFKKGEISFGVGYEPALADISYAFTIALRKANLSVRSSKLNTQNMVSLNSSQKGSILPLENHAPKKERSLPWWDDMRYYIHGDISLSFSETRWNMHGTTNPYEKFDKFQIVSGCMDIQQSDGRVSFSAREFKIFVSSLESIVKNCSLKPPDRRSIPFIYSSSFSLEVIMDWKCESGNHLNHYLHALPNEGVPRSKVYDPFRSISLSLRWNFSLRPCPSDRQDISTNLNESVFISSQKLDDVCVDTPTMNLGPHDLVWLFKWWSMFYNPPHKLRSFSRWPRFGIPKATRSGNLSLDKVMTEFFFRVDATPACIKHVTLGEDDPASGLTFRMTKLKYELCYSRGKKHYTFDCKREPLDLVYRGLDLNMLKAFSYRDFNTVNQDYQTGRKSSQSVSSKRTSNGRSSYTGICSDKNQDDGFLLSSDHFTIRRQAPKADPTRLLALQDAGRKNLDMTYARSEFEDGIESDHTRSDPSDDEEYNVVIADNCQLVFVYGLKLLWTIQNRDAVWSWVGGISKAFEHPKPSPSRQYAQRKSLEDREKRDRSEVSQYDSSKSLPVSCKEASFQPLQSESSYSHMSTSPTKSDSLPSNLNSKNGLVGDEEEGTRHFMVNVIQPQFNLHAEDGNGRFLLAAASGRVLARSFHKVVNVVFEVIEKALGTGDIKVPDTEPEMTWKRTEYSVMLKHVQAHVAPTDVDPGAGLQWLPEIVQNKKRTGALLERVFTPCQMYFRYTRHKGGLADLKVKPLKELTFNSPNISATMTSRQFNVMLGVLTNLLFARLPKPQKSILSYPTEDDDIEEEVDEVVPDGVEEVELARIDLEQKEREIKLLIDDIRSIESSSNISMDLCLQSENESEMWMITGKKSTLVQGLSQELGNIQKSRKTASVGLRLALQKAAQIRLMEEKNKSPSCAMRISVKINKVVWSMLADGKTFAEAEINDMIYDFDRDYKDIGVAQFTTRSFAVRNLLPNVKSDILLSSWNPPLEWGRDVMLRVDAKQGVPKDGTSPLELFQVEIYPLKIHLSETMYRMMWEYFFPEEEQDSHRRQEVWKVSTTAGTRRGRKSSSGAEAGTSTSYSLKDFDASERLSSTTATSSLLGPSQSSTVLDTSQASKLHNLKANNAYASNSELQQTSSYDRILEENMTESRGNEIIMYVQSSDISSSRGSPLNSVGQMPHAAFEDISRTKSKDSKSVRPGRASHEEKKINKSQDEKRSRTRKMMEFHNIKISQVELIVTYEGSRFAVNELRLLLDTFNCVEFTGTWRRLFSKIKKRIIWGVLKSVTGMQGKKFKDKSQNSVPDLDEYFSDIDGGPSDDLPQLFKRTSDGAGEGFVNSIKGLFNSQRRKAKALIRTMRGDLDNEAGHPEWTEVEIETPALARQITMKGKKLIRKHTKKFHRPKGLKKSETTSQSRGSQPSSPPKDTGQNQSDSSSASPSHNEDTSKE